MIKEVVYLMCFCLFISCSKEELSEEISVGQEVVSLSNNNAAAQRSIIRVSRQSGNTNYQKLKNAIEEADNTNVVLLDVNVNFTRTDRSINVNRQGIIIRGASRGNGKFRMTRVSNFRSSGSIANSLLTIQTNNIIVENIDFLITGNGFKRGIFVGNTANRRILYRNLTFRNCLFRQQSRSGSSRGLFFEGSFENVVVEGCTFDNWFGLVARDCPTLRNFGVNNCTFSRGSHQISFDGALLGEDDPTFGIGEDIIEHSNISITNSNFELTQNFNIALANTRNVLIRNNVFAGGTANYSQPIHIEDATRNVRIIGNDINNPADTAIIIFTTGRVGHGQGRRLTEAERREHGSGNILIRNNTIRSGQEAVFAQYLRGFLRFEGNNTIISNNNIPVRVNRTVPNVNSRVIFADNDNSRYNRARRNVALNNGDIRVDDNVANLIIQ